MEPDNVIPPDLWKKVPLGMRYLQVLLSDGRTLDGIWVDERGAIEGQEAEGIAGYRGALNQAFVGIQSEVIIAVRPMVVPWYRFGRNPWIRR